MNEVINHKRAFTLIELLVVVLIIGILAAVAMPQYTKAVEKARMTEMQTMLANLEHGAELWRLGHDLPEEIIDITEQLDIDYSGLTKSGDYYCTNKGVCGNVRAGHNLIYMTFGLWRKFTPDTGAPDYGFISTWAPANGWQRKYFSCAVDISSYGLESFGYTQAPC